MCFIILTVLNHFRNNLKHIDLTNKSEVPYQSAAGISLSLERLVQGAIIGTDDEPGFNSASCDVCVCSTSSCKATTKEKIKVFSTRLIFEHGKISN